MTLVQKDRLLFNAAYPDRFRRRAADKLRAIGVEVVLDDALDESNPGKTLKGKSIDADLVVSRRKASQRSPSDAAPRSQQSARGPTRTSCGAWARAC